MKLSLVATSLLNIASGQDEGMIFTNGAESHQISYLDTEFSETDVNVLCTPSQMCIKLSKDFLVNEKITTNYDGLHLKDCVGGNKTDTPTHIELCTELGMNTCGTEMHMNSTHVSYLNRLFTVNGPTDSVDVGSVIMDSKNEYIVPWHCTYPLEYLVGLENDYFIPQIYEVVTVTLLLQPGEGTGQFPVAMMLYTDNTYDTVYQEAPMLNVTDRLYVQSHLLKGPEAAVLQTKECWATASANTDDAIRYQLIEDFCVEENADTQASVDMITNGVGFTSKWEANVFKFVNQPHVHLHCRIRICFPTEENSCAEFNCDYNRKRRSAGSEEDVIVSIGPLALGDDVLTLFAEEQAREMEKEVIEEVFAESSNVSLPGYFIYALIGCVCTVVILLAAIIVLSYKRKQSQKTRQLEVESAAYAT